MLPFINATPISPLKELIAYEALWSDKKASFQYLAKLFSKNPGARPSDFVANDKILEISEELTAIILNNPYKVNLLIKGTFDFPKRLNDAKDPIELLYYSGYLDLLNTPSIAIVGTRNPSEQGIVTTGEITSELVKNGFTIVSGLAKGIDTRAHRTAIEKGGRTIAVLGTPLNMAYPKENEELQMIIAQEHLVISQVPFYRYTKQDYRLNKFFFLERNKTMSALTDATLIIEAGESSGSLTQAAAALYQRRKLLIWADCIKNKNITWPERLVKSGAIVVESYEEIARALNRR